MLRWGHSALCNLFAENKLIEMIATEGAVPLPVVQLQISHRRTVNDSGMPVSIEKSNQDTTRQVGRVIEKSGPLNGRANQLNRNKAARTIGLTEARNIESDDREFSRFKLE